MNLENDQEIPITQFERKTFNLTNMKNEHLLNKKICMKIWKYDQDGRTL